MNEILKYIFATICIFVGTATWINRVYAEAPYSPDFSLSTHTLQEPSALPQNYNMSLPNAWEYYAMQQPEQNILVPTTPVIMEVCAITNKTTYIYPTKEALMQGCYSGDNGLLHLILQPYQYLPFLNKLQPMRLMPSTRQVGINPQIVIYYKSTEKTQNVLTSVEFGDLADMNGIFIVNGDPYQYNQDVVSAFYKLIHEVWDTMYLPETNQIIRGYMTYPASCNYCY